MFARLFAESGLSLDRLKSLLEVGAAGSIVKAAGGDPVRQSQYSRQIKELEDFFRVKLIERYGKGTRLTANGKELARISRFFLLGLSNFQRGCLTEEQTFQIGASATFIRRFLLPLVSQPSVLQTSYRYVTEVVGGDEIERRLHDLTLDFGITTAPEISRPLQLTPLGTWHLGLWVPQALHRTEDSALRAFNKQVLPLVLPVRELDLDSLSSLHDYRPHLVCDDFLQARTALEEKGLAALLPDFLAPEGKAYLRVSCPRLESQFQYQLAWNPRLIRLNPHVVRRRDFLVESLARAMKFAQNTARRQA